MLRITEGAVKSLLHRARATLHGAGTSAGNHDQPPPGRQARRTLVARCVDALNRRDADALVTLFDPIAVNELVGGGELTGHDALRMTVARWAADPRPAWAEAGVLDGRDAPSSSCPPTRIPKRSRPSSISSSKAIASRPAMVPFLPVIEHAAHELGVAQRPTATARASVPSP